MIPMGDLIEEEELVDENLFAQTRRKGYVSQNHPIIAHAPKKPDSSTPLKKPAPILNSVSKFATQEELKLDYNVEEVIRKMEDNISIMDPCKISQ